MHISEFGWIGNSKVQCIKLSKGLITAEILDYGAAIRSLCIDGKDIVCGFDSIDAYLEDTSYQGAVIGRYANRIADGKFSLDGELFTLNKNEKGVTHLHGGSKGFDKKIWKVYKTNIGEESESVTLSIFSPDGEEGYPGTVSVTVTYTVTSNALVIDYKAKSDRKTVLNLSNHSYFNLNGYDSGDIYSHFLKINSEKYSEIDDRFIPKCVSPVENTPFDFREQKAVGNDINQLHPQLVLANGYDHNFYIDQLHTKKITLFNKTLTEAAVLEADNLKMSVFTDMPCVQLYTANFMCGEHPFKNGVKQKKHNAICLETQYSPNSPNENASILKADELYDKTTAFIFERKQVGSE